MEKLLKYWIASFNFVLFSSSLDNEDLWPDHQYDVRVPCSQGDLKDPALGRHQRRSQSATSQIPREVLELGTELFHFSISTVFVFILKRYKSVVLLVIITPAFSIVDIIPCIGVATKAVF